MFALPALAVDLSVTGDVTVKYDVNSSLPWVYDSAWSDTDHIAYKAGNSGSSSIDASNIALTVTEPGIITFDYKTSISNEYARNYVLWYNIGEALTTSNYAEADNYDTYTYYYGVTDWTSQSVSILQSDIDAAGGDSVTLYIAYVRLGNQTQQENKVAIANVEFTAGNCDVTISSDGGVISSTATDGSTIATNGTNDVYLGTTINLTATPDSGNQFYGWIQDGVFMTSDASYSFTVADDTEVEAVFATTGSYLGRVGDDFYTTDAAFAAALNAMTSGESAMLYQNATLTENVTIVEGAKLYIPYDVNYDEDGSQEGGKDGYTASAKITTTDAYATLTIESGKTLTVDGTLTIGAVISYPSTNYQGHTSGAHGEIINNGKIIVNGEMETYGFVTGTGEVTVNGALYEPFIVLDFSGGTNTLAMVGAGQSPFKHYAMQNVQTTLTLNPNSTLYGYCNLYAGSSYNTTIAPIISTGDSLFKTGSNTTVVRTYDGDKTVGTYTDIGTTTYEVTGGMTFQSLTMEIFGFEVTTAHVEFPIPYNYQFELSNGDYWVTQGLNLLPGASITVASDATFTIDGDEYIVGTTTISEDDIDEDGNYLGTQTSETVDVTMSPRFYVMDGLTQSDMSGKSYPTGEQLDAAGFSKSATFIMDGEMTIESGAIFGGVVQTNGLGSIDAELGALLEDNYLALGGLSSNDDNRAYVWLSGRINTATGIVEMIGGNQYNATNGTSFTLDSYYTRYMISSTSTAYDAQASGLAETDVGYVSRYSDTSSVYHILTEATVEINQTMVGTWVDGDVAEDAYKVVATADQTTVAPDGEVTLTLTVQAAQAFDSATFTLNYDSDLLTYTSSSFEDYFGVNSDETGTLLINGSALTTDGYAAGNVTVGTVTFTAKSAGSAEISISNATVTPVEAATSVSALVGDAFEIAIGETVSETAPTTDVTGDTATATVDETIFVEKYEEFTIVATTESETTAAEVTIPSAVASQLSDATALTVTTDSSVVTFNDIAVDEIATADSDVTLKVSVADSTDDNITTVTLELVDSNNATITFAGDGDITGKATITVPYTLADGGETVQVYYVNGDEKELITGASYEDGYVTFTTTHFSEYQISTYTATTSEDEEFEVTFIHQSYYEDGLVATSETNYVYADGTVTFNIDLGENSGLYTYQVTYTIDGDDVAVNNSDNAYEITGVITDLEITVTSYKLGDVDLDNTVIAQDEVAIGKVILTQEDLTDYYFLVTDVNGDGSITAEDEVAIGKNIISPGTTFR